MEAFIRAMERRREAGRPLDRHSVASFFVSRVDTEVDKRLEAAGRNDLAGRAGLANARAAYPHLEALHELGGVRQVRLQVVGRHERQARVRVVGEEHRDDRHENRHGAHEHRAGRQRWACATRAHRLSLPRR